SFEGRCLKSSTRSLSSWCTPVCRGVGGGPAGWPGSLYVSPSRSGVGAVSTSKRYFGSSSLKVGLGSSCPDATPGSSLAPARPPAQSTTIPVTSPSTARIQLSPSGIIQWADHGDGCPHEDLPPALLKCPQMSSRGHE